VLIKGNDPDCETGVPRIGGTHEADEGEGSGGGAISLPRGSRG